MLADTDWPKADQDMLTEDSVRIGVQVNGKIRDTVSLPVDADEDVARAAALASGSVPPDIALSAEQRSRSVAAGKTRSKTLPTHLAISVGALPLILLSPVIAISCWPPPWTMVVSSTH